MIAREPVPLPPYAEEVTTGLSSPQKTLPCKLFYDEIGSAVLRRSLRPSRVLPHSY